MARGRIVSKQISTDKGINILHDDSALAFTWTIPHLDRDGLITGEPMLLWAQIAPWRTHWRDRMATFIQQWLELELVQTYDDPSHGRVLYFPSFRRHQPNFRYSREAASIFSPPPGWDRHEKTSDPDVISLLATTHHITEKMAAAGGLAPNSDIAPELVQSNVGSSPPKDQDQEQDQEQEQDQDQQQQHATPAAVDDAIASLFSLYSVTPSKTSKAIILSTTPEMTLAWMLWIEEEEQAWIDNKQATLISKLRDKIEPPPGYLDAAKFRLELWPTLEHWEPWREWRLGTLLSLPNEAWPEHYLAGITC